MNRKLLNGFLVVALAVGGVGTFTSCKDENSGQIENLDQKALQAQLNAIRDVKDSEFKSNLEDWLDYLTNNYSQAGFKSYQDAVQALKKLNALYDDIVAMNDVYQAILNGNYDNAQEFVDALYDMLFNNKINGSGWYKFFFQMAERASSLDVNQTYNPVFGSINLPIGLKTTVLAAYTVGGSKANGYEFPTQVRRNDAVVDWKSLGMDEMEVAMTLSAIEKLNPANVVNINEGDYTAAEGTYGEMGAVYVTINPSGNDFTSDKYTYSFINSKGESVFEGEDLDVMVNEDLLSFGYKDTDTRADVTGVYKVKVNVPDNFEATLDFDDAKEFLGDVKDAFENKTISNIAYVGEQLYKRLNNALPAYAVKVAWEENVVDQMTGEVTGTVENSVISNFDLAAAVVHPLSYGLDIEAVLGPQLGTVAEKIPTFSPLEDYLTKIQNKLHISFTPIAGIQIEDMTFDMTLEKGVVVITDAQGTEVARMPYGGEGIEYGEDTFGYFVEMLGEKYGDAVKDNMDQIVSDLNASIANINKQIQSYVAKVENINSYIDRIKNSSKLDYADKLIDIYNKFAEKAKQVLSNPNHYLQVAALYSDGDGHYHRLSSDPYSPSPVKVEDANSAMELLLASYTGDVVVPSYQKYVAVTKVDDNAASSDQNKGYNINTVIPGQQHRAALQVGNFDAGTVLTVSYLSVDYHGMVSMQNYYVQIVK